MFLCSGLLGIGTAAFSLMDLGLPITLSIPFGLLMLPSATFQYSPALAFLLIFSDVSSCLSCWANKITRHLREQRLSGSQITMMETNESLGNCKRFLVALQKTSNIFSCHLFGMTSLLLFGIICTMYRSIAFFIGQYEFDYQWIFWVLVFGYGGQSYNFWFVILFLGVIADSVRQNVKNLLAEVTILNLNKIKTDPDRVEDMREIRNEVMFHFGQFEGYPALGFFTLNRPCLTTLTASFVTYLIILLQFRTGEES